MHRLTRTLLVCAALFIAFAHAQHLSANQLLDKMQATAESLKDASFTLSGELTDADGSKLTLDINVTAIPDKKLLRADFIQPAALADNFIIIEDGSVYNYLFTTNQVTIFNAGDPNALGGLLPSGKGTSGFSLDLSHLFKGWKVTEEGYGKSPAGNVYKLRFDNQAKNAQIDHVEATILDGKWIPYTLTFVQKDGSDLASLKFTNVKLNSGLKPSKLKYIPPDAQTIDQRK
jgi:outer membrane lipoprotein-sorting protein